MPNIRGAHFTITLTGAVQGLADLGVRKRIREICFSAGPANANPIYLGMGPTLGADDYGVRLPAPVAGEPAPPFILGEFDDGSVEAENFYVLGTDGETLRLMVLWAEP